MRLRRIDKYLLFLAGLFVVAILKTTDFPGEEVVADAYRVAIFRPLLAQAAAAAARAPVDLVRLRSELASAQREVTRLREELEHTRDLRAYFEKLEWHTTPRATPASVVTVDADPFRRSFKIDRGARAGMEVGFPVVTGTALLGLIRSVDIDQATVLQVNDATFRIEVEIETESGPLPCVAEGNKESGLVLRLVRGARTLSPGLPVFTSAYHKLVPPGLLVGTIASISDPDGDGVCAVTVEAAASLLRLAQVEVLRGK